MLVVSRILNSGVWNVCSRSADEDLRFSKKSEICLVWFRNSVGRLIKTSGFMKDAYAELKRLKSKPKNISWGIQDNNGTVLTIKDDILEHWAEFYDPCLWGSTNHQP